MKNASIFCLTLNANHKDLIEDLSYIPVILGDNQNYDGCLSDKNGFNISKKNPYYGEYTFHYWIWKNYLHEIKTEWVGFCQYRKFFSEIDVKDESLDYEYFNKILVKNIDVKYQNYECILGNKFSVENFKLSKIIKNHLPYFLSNPVTFFNKKKRNLRFHFDLFHGKGNLDLAINLLDEENKKDFKKFMMEKNAFNPHNMFFCKKEILKNYYEVVFPWLEKCESVFGFNDLKGYGLKRIYGFLAERFLSYWFTKNYKIKELPIIFKDLNDYK